MSKNKAKVPDAWEDDWETQADQLVAEPEEPEPEPEPRLSKAERKAKHDQANRQLWEDAEASKEKPLFLQAKDEPAYKTEFKPAMKVLSRKPKIASRSDATSGMANMGFEDEDSEEERRKQAAASYEERKQRAIREREEKQRRYQEVREKLFGSDSLTSDGPGKNSSPRSKGRSRGGGSLGDQFPARQETGQKKQLYEPGYTEKPGSVFLQRRKDGDGSGTSTPSEEKPTRAPRGPDANGRGGFGVALRGGKTSNIA